ncbi:LysR family transcriptional regulator [Brevibacterium yomogidense]|uniref:LysR family transcriptional regulator n=1 Tax=Brevibacterium yomogidense TaxID=946573 RepID=UPI0018DF463B|nr:LysR family transcriptional regulator [Brevibacterium yomogidense]
MFTLDQVRCFVAVAEHLHFGRAAAELNMTQPPLSRQIQKLERHVGAELLDRRGRGVELTAAGQLFLAESRKLLGLAGRAPEGARRVASGQLGLVRLGFTAAAGFGPLSGLLSTVKRELPGLDIDLVEMVTAEQLQALDEERIDMAIGRLHTPLPNLESRLLLKERLMLAVPADSEMARRGSALTKADIRDQAIIMHSASKARYFYDIIVGNFDIAPEQMRYTLGQIMTMISLVAGGHGIAFVPESAQRTRVPGVEYLTFRDFDEDVVELHALWRPGSRNPAVRSLLDVMS